MKKTSRLKRDQVGVRELNESKPFDEVSKGNFVDETVNKNQLLYRLDGMLLF